MANSGVNFQLFGRNWDKLNPIMNSSDELQSMLDKVADELVEGTKNYIHSTASSAADYMESNTGKDVAEPNERNGLRMRFVYLPNIGFEMKYGALKGALDDLGSA